MTTRYIKSYSTQVDEYADIQVGGLNRPYVAYLEDEDRIDWDSYKEPPYDYSKDYFTIVAPTNGYVRLCNRNGAQTVTLECSIDEGSSWRTLNTSTPFRVAEGNTEVWIRGNNSKGFCQAVGGTNGYHFLYYSSSNAAEPYQQPVDKIPFSMKGNIMSLITKTNFDQALDLTAYGPCLFYSLFSGTLVTSAENLVLPATGLTTSCYAGMFYECTSLVTAPKVLPSIVGTSNIYQGMFAGCTSLVNPPEVIELINYHPNTCASMFAGCSQLTKTPIMKFSVNYTYPSQQPYAYMFQSCPLTEIILITQNAPTGTANLLQNWTYEGAQGAGIFYAHPSAIAGWEAWPRGANGVPVGWTIVEYQDN